MVCFFNAALGFTLRFFLPKKIVMTVMSIVSLLMLADSLHALTLINGGLITLIGILTWFLL